MKSRSFYIGSLVLVVTAAFLGAKFETETVSSQTTSGASAEQSQATAGDFQQILGILRDKELRISSPKLLVEAIQKAQRIARASCCPEQDPAHAGEMKQSPELLAALIDLLDFQRPKKDNIVGDAISEFDISSNMDVYPSIYAIAAIGRTALPSMVEILERNEKDSIMFKNALATIRLIHDRDDIAAANFLRVQASVSTDLGRKNLLIAAELLTEEQKKSENRIEN